MGNYRKYMREGVKLKTKVLDGGVIDYKWVDDPEEPAVMLDNIRFTANPDSF